MAINYEWTFDSCDTVPLQDGLENVVATVNWRLTATDDDGVTASIYGSVGLSPPVPEGFISFEDLTKNQVEAWVIEKLNATARPMRGPGGRPVQDTISVVERMKEGLAGQIDNIKNPPVVTQTFGFGA